MTLLKTRSIYYKDINLIAQPNNLIKSRKEIKKNLSRIFVSPMSAVIGKRFAETALELGLQVCLHRFCDIKEQFELYHTLNCQEYHDRIWVAIGLGDYERFHLLRGKGCNKFLIDAANGYLGSVVSYANTLSKFKVDLVVGNVHSSEGIKLYKSIPNVHIRVGIGNGSGCDTSIMTAINRGQVTELMECSKAAKRHSIGILADGGISTPSDACKALGLGANAIMLGGHFAKAEEAQNVINGEYMFWGSSSHKQQKLSQNVRNHSEGKELNINTKEIKPLRDLVSDLAGGISSAVSYAGFDKWDDFIGNGVFEVKL